MPATASIQRGSQMNKPLSRSSDLQKRHDLAATIPQDGSRRDLSSSLLLPLRTPARVAHRPSPNIISEKVSLGMQPLGISPKGKSEERWERPQRDKPNRTEFLPLISAINLNKWWQDQKHKPYITDTTHICRMAGEMEGCMGDRWMGEWDRWMAQEGDWLAWNLTKARCKSYSWNLSGEMFMFLSETIVFLWSQLQASHHLRSDAWGLWIIPSCGFTQTLPRVSLGLWNSAWFPHSPENLPELKLGNHTAHTQSQCIRGPLINLFIYFSYPIKARELSGGQTPTHVGLSRLIRQLHLPLYFLLGETQNCITEQ